MIKKLLITLTLFTSLSFSSTSIDWNTNIKNRPFSGVGAGVGVSGGNLTTVGNTTTQFAFPMPNCALSTCSLTSLEPLLGPVTKGFSWVLPTNGTNSLCTSNVFLETLPTASWVASIYRIPVATAGLTGTPVLLGTVTIATTGAQTWSVTQTTFNAGDGFEVLAPSSVDVTAAGVYGNICEVK